MMHPLLLTLKKVAPNIAFSVSKTPDPDFVWDGDGPDPINDYLYPHDVDFKASVLLHGEIIDGTSCLGGCYYREDEPVGDVNGYLAQKLDDALDDLPDLHLEDAGEDVKAAKAYLKEYMQDRWQKQQKGKP